MDVADVLAVSNRSQTIAQIASFGVTRPVAIVEGSAIRMEGFSVSGGFFDLLGVQPLIDRGIRPKKPAGTSACSSDLSAAARGPTSSPHADPGADGVFFRLSLARPATRDSYAKHPPGEALAKL